jgi:hypothetical protein
VKGPSADGFVKVIVSSEFAQVFTQLSVNESCAVKVSSVNIVFVSTRVSPLLAVKVSD